MVSKLDGLQRSNVSDNKQALPGNREAQTNFELLKRHRLHTTDAFWFEVDEYGRGGDQLLIAHVRVVRWSPSVRKHLHHVWNTFRTCVTAPIFTLGEVDDKKFDHFVRSLGYQPFQTVTCENGEQRRLYIHTI